MLQLANHSNIALNKGTLPLLHPLDGFTSILQSRDGRLWNLYARLLATKVITIMTIIAKYLYVTNAMLTNHVSMGTIYIAIAIATSLIVKAT